MRVVPVRRIKSASQFIQAIPAVLFGFLRFTPRGTLPRLYQIILVIAAPLAAIPAWLLGSGALLAAILIVGSGLRTLSGDYLIRVSSMVHGSSDSKTRVSWSPLGAIVRRVFGGQGGRAGFDYMKRMILRDWQFRRQLMQLLPMLAFMGIGLFRAGLASPFNPSFTATHFIPHIVGFIIFTSAFAMPFGNDYQGAWLFSLAPHRALGRFAQGVHASLWLGWIVVPNVALFAPFAWRWGFADATAFTIYSICVASVYLAFSMRNIDGIPFGKQIGAKALQGNASMLRMIIFIFFALVAVGFQYLLFRSASAVYAATALIGIGAYFATRRAVTNLRVAMIHHLSTMSQTSTMIYNEVDVGF
jgi:hypothetical protein